MSAADDLRTRAEQGNPQAQFDLGTACAKPPNPQKNLVQDLVQAAEWFRKAAAQGHADAQFQLGLAFQFGSGVELDKSQAINCLGQAAEQNHLSAQMQLGWLHHSDKNYSDTVKWWRRAAELGCGPGAYCLGMLYTSGEHVPADYPEAIKWLRLAAEGGHSAAQYSLGGHYAEGLGVEKSDADAMLWFEKAAKQGYAGAHSNLARLRQTAAQKAKAQPAPAGQDLPTFLKAHPHGIHILQISRVYGGSNLRLYATIFGPSYEPESVEIICMGTADYSIRPKNPATMMGGPPIQFHEKHRLLESSHLQMIPGGDGEVYRPPLDLKLLILDQSHVIAERFELRKIPPKVPTPPAAS